jgi:cytochrome c553
MRTRKTMYLIGLLCLAGCDYKVPKVSEFAEAKEATASGEELFELCKSCHGAYGEGQEQFHAPAIAGLPQWYIEAQLKKFRSGARGTHPNDITGMMMRPMTRSFHTAGDLTTVAAFVANMNKVAPEPVMAQQGDAARGKALYTPCTACHGQDGAGNEQVKAPPLNHASDWYLLAQLKKFKDGVRGGTGTDIEGAQMVAQVNILKDEQAMKDVVAHIATLRR